MTREEAKEILQGSRITSFRPNGTARVKEALNMAIEALSEPSGDLISRADAMAELREWVKRANENGETPTWNDAVSLIGSLPSADAVSRYEYDRLYAEADYFAKRLRSADAVDVVRCKDCKHWHSNTEFCSIWSFHFQNVAQRTLSHDYCSRGERREESEVEE